MKRITMMCVLGALALGGCQEQELPTEPLGPPSDPSFTIIQRDGFHVLPPVGRGHSTAGFLGTLSPRVDVCVWDGAKCEATGHLAFFTLLTGTGEATLKVSSDNVYEVEWDTRVVEDPDGIDFEQTYQIVVTLGGELLGTADIRFFDGGKAKSTIDEFTLKDGRTLPIRFGMTVEAVLGLLVEDVDVPETGDFVVQTFSTTGGVQKAEVPSENAAFQVDGDNVQIPGNGDEFTLVIVEKALDPDGNCEAAYGGPQSGGCYVFETIPAGVTFFEGGDTELPAGLAGVCRDTTLGPTDDPFRLAKFDDGETTFPDPSPLNVVDCGEEGIEVVLQRLPPVLRGLARALLPLPRPLHARDEGETGLVGGFSTIFWAVPLELQANPADPFPGGPFVAGSEITLSFQLLGTHDEEPVDDVVVHFEVNGNGGTLSSATATTASGGIVGVTWTLPKAAGSFELTASVPGTDASLSFAAVVDPSIPILLTPEDGALLPQNNAVEECDLHPARGHGIRVDFDWQDVIGADRYHIFAKNQNATLPIVNQEVESSEYTHLSCNSMAVFLEGWEWMVRAVFVVNSDETFGPFSPANSWTYEPCFLEDETPCYVPILTSVEVDPESATLAPQQSLPLMATPIDQRERPYSDPFTLTWSSDNQDVATVDNDGVVIAVAPGEATITATATATISGTVRVGNATITVEGFVIDG